MANRLVPRSSFFLCTGLNASTWTLPTAVCLRFRSASRPRPGLIPPRCWALPELAEKTIATRRVPRVFRPGTRPGIRHETVSSIHGAQPTDAAADGLCSVYRDRIGGRPLFLGAGAFRGCRIQRRPGWTVGSQVAPADSAWAISRSHRGQALVEHDVSGALHSA